MKKIALILSCLLLSASALAEDGSAKSIANGKRLFEEKPSKCLRCHKDGTDLSTATNIDMLEEKVRSCDVSHETNWFDDEIMDVVAYLEQEYYLEQESYNSSKKMKDTVGLDNKEDNMPKKAVPDETEVAVQ